MNNQPMTGSEFIFLAVASGIAWAWVFWGPSITARIKVWRSKAPKSWSKRNHWS